MEGKQELSGFWKADEKIKKIAKYISYPSGICLFVMALWATANVIWSKLTHSSIPSTTDWIAYLLVPTVFLACAYEVLDKGFVYVDIVTGKFPPIVNKIVLTISYSIGFAVSVIMSFKQFELAFKNMQTGKTSSTLALSFPIWPFSAILAIGLGLMALAMLWYTIRIYVKKPEKISEKEEVIINE